MNIILITMLLAIINSANNSPFGEVALCDVYFPEMLLYISSLPNLAFRSPNIVTASLLGVPSKTLCRSS
jgi:hypothetical protein